MRFYSFLSRLALMILGATILFACSSSVPKAMLSVTPESFVLSQNTESQIIILTNTGAAAATNLVLPTLSAPLIKNINSTCKNHQSLAAKASCNYVVSVDYAHGVVGGNQTLSFGYNNGESQQITNVAASWSSSTQTISVSALSESQVTQAGGAVTISATLNNSVNSTQIITLIDSTNPSDNITITSNPSPCSLINSNESCIFTITTSSTLSNTSLGQKTFIIHNSGNALLSESSFQLQVVSPYLIYYAHNGENGYTGNMLEQAINKGASGITVGIQGADYLCNHDESKPVLPVANYKAMIVDGVNRRACYSFDCVFEGAGENIDWVLKPTAAYKNINEQISVVTNESGIYTFYLDYQDLALQQLSLAPFVFLPDNFTLNYGVAFQWTGLSSLWTMYPPSSATNTGLCSTITGGITSYWNKASSYESGVVGNQFSYSSSAPGFSSPTLSYTQIATGYRPCAESALVSVDSTWINGLICVQQ